MKEEPEGEIELVGHELAIPFMQNTPEMQSSQRELLTNL
jgi:hypothetical protein